MNHLFLYLAHTDVTCVATQLKKDTNTSRPGDAVNLKGVKESFSVFLYLSIYLLIYQSINLYISIYLSIYTDVFMWRLKLMITYEF